MRDRDEPMLDARAGPPAPDSTDSVPIAERVRGLLSRQRFAILCTQGDGQPYGSVVAIAAGETPGHLLFATGRSTRKYRLLESCDRVAVVIDDRDRHPDELMSVEALTATGRAREVEDPTERGEDAARLLSRHPELRPFLEAPSTALFRVDVVRYLHVWRFQEVRQWVPTNPS